jgi:hypothetical protein
VLYHQFYFSLGWTWLLLVLLVLAALNVLAGPVVLLSNKGIRRKNSERCCTYTAQQLQSNSWMKVITWGNQFIIGRRFPMALKTQSTQGYPNKPFVFQNMWWISWPLSQCCLYFTEKLS